MRKKISQREAVRLRKRVALLGERVDLALFTPTPRWTIAKWELTPEQAEQVKMGERFRLSLRVERFDTKYILFAFQEPFR